MKAEYKNSIATKKKITSAYLTLLNKSKKISVTDIVELAGINRGTFYLHFNNVKEVEKYMGEEISLKFKVIETAFRQKDISNNPELLFHELNGILKEDIPYYKLIIGAAENIKLIDIIKKYILVAISNNFEVMKYVTSLDSFRLVVNYIVGGIMDCYTEWFKGNLNCELDHICDFLSVLVKNGLNGVIHNAN